MTLPELKIVVAAVDQASKTIGKVGGSVKGLSGRIKKLTPSLQKAGLALSAIGAAGILLTKNLVDAGTELRSLRKAFDELRKGSSLSLEALKRASEGVVSEVDLIAASNRAMMLGIDPDFLPEMMGHARKAAVAMGTSTSQAFNDISVGIGRMQPLILDNLGVVVKVGEANEKYAESIDKTVSQLTEEEKKMAFLNGTMEALRLNSERLGDVTDEAQDTQRRFTAQIADLKAKIGEDLLPVITDLLKGVSGLVKWFSQLPTPLRKVASGGLLAATAIGAIGGPTLLLVSQLPKMAAGLHMVTGAMTGTAAAAAGVAGAIAGVAIPLTALAAAIMVVQPAWEWTEEHFGFGAEQAKQFNREIEWMTELFGRLTGQTDSTAIAVEDLDSKIGSITNSSLNLQTQINQLIDLQSEFNIGTEEGAEAHSRIQTAIEGTTKKIIENAEAMSQVPEAIESELVGKAQEKLEAFRKCATDKSKSWRETAVQDVSQLVSDTNKLITEGFLRQAQDNIQAYVDCSLNKHTQMVEQINEHIEGLVEEHGKNQKKINELVDQGLQAQATIWVQRNEEINRKLMDLIGFRTSILQQAPAPTLPADFEVGGGTFRLVEPEGYQYGGRVKKTGTYRLHAGEEVLNAGEAAREGAPSIGINMNNYFTGSIEPGTDMAAKVEELWPPLQAKILALGWGRQ